MGARLTAGWDIPLTINITTGPVIQYALDYSKIYGYSENAHSSTAMHFGNQVYYSKIAGAGWRINMNFAGIMPYAQIDGQRQFGDDTWPITGGLKSSQTTFTSTSARQEKRWKNFTLGASIPLGAHAAIFARISKASGLSRGERFTYNLGGSLSF